eukprot:Gb_40985 [translate_table: standard]
MGIFWGSMMKIFVFGFVLLLSFSAASAQNITKILHGFPQYKDFNDLLTQTRLADEINSRTTITVLVVDNGAMSALNSKHLGLSVAKKVLSLHVLLDYFDPQKLHQITNGTTLSTTLYQTTGNAAGNQGFLNITDLKGGKVGFGAVTPGSKLESTYVKSVKEIPYNMSVLQISQLIMPTGLEAPSPSPNDLNITAVLNKAGCKIFAQMITSTGVLKTYEDAVAGGLTLFAPTDEAFQGRMMPKLKKLSSAQQVSILEYHAIPVYSPLGTLKTTHGPISTLATNGASKYALTVTSSGDSVSLNTGVNKCTISATLVDDQPIAVFTVDQLLQPSEIFAAAPAPAPVPVLAPSSTPATAPTPEAVSPSPSPPTSSPSPSSAVSPPAPPASSPAEGPAVSGPVAAKSSAVFAAPLKNAGSGLLALLGVVYCALML